MNLDLETMMRLACVLLVAIPIHEFAHAISAVWRGDDTPRKDGRLSILPWDHLEIAGTVFIVISSLIGFGIGWGKPVLVNPLNFRSPRWDMVIVAAAGPFSNLVMGTLAGLALRFLAPAGALNETMTQLLFIFVLVNYSLMFFNLIPVYPLDGSKILSGFLPPRLARDYDIFMVSWGQVLLFGLILTASYTVGPLIATPMIALVRLVIGA
jgi:Zn-dependent protease